LISLFDGREDIRNTNTISHSTYKIFQLLILPTQSTTEGDLSSLASKLNVSFSFKKLNVP
jgi:hypothetical protein